MQLLDLSLLYVLQLTMRCRIQTWNVTSRIVGRQAKIHGYTTRKHILFGSQAHRYRAPVGARVEDTASVLATERSPKHPQNEAFDGCGDLTPAIIPPASSFQATRAPPSFLAGYHINLDLHLGQPKPCNPKQRPDGLVIWHVLDEVLLHGFEDLFLLLRPSNVVRLDTKHRRPTILDSRNGQSELHIGECLGNLRRNILGDCTRFWVPAACVFARSSVRCGNALSRGLE